MTPLARSTTARGRVGEHIARDFLWASGHRIVASNARVGRDELDLVTVAPSGALVFTEVRASAASSGAFPYGLATLRGSKLARWSRAAARWRARHPEFHGHRCRFDAVGVNLETPCTVSYVPGVVLPAGRPHPASPLILSESSP